MWAPFATLASSHLTTSWLYLLQRIVSPQTNHFQEIQTLHFNQKGSHHQDISEFIVALLLEF